MISYELVIKKCKICKNMRKMVKGSERDKNDICGNCWNWNRPEKDTGTGV
jgi:hypothetical protein